MVRSEIPWEDGRFKVGGGIEVEGLGRVVGGGCRSASSVGCPMHILKISCESRLGKVASMSKFLLSESDSICPYWSGLVRAAM